MMWIQLLAAAAGLWLMAAPAILGFGPPVETNLHVFGPIIATLGAVAAAECTRGVRWLNVPCGAWVAISPLVLDAGTSATITSMVSGALVVLLSLIKGRVTTRMGGGWRALAR